MKTDESAHESKGAADEELPEEQKPGEGEAANGEALDSEREPTEGNRPGVEGAAATLPAAEPKSEGDTHSEN